MHPLKVYYNIPFTRSHRLNYTFHKKTLEQLFYHKRICLKKKKRTRECSAKSSFSSLLDFLNAWLVVEQIFLLKSSRSCRDEVMKDASSKVADSSKEKTSKEDQYLLRRVILFFFLLKCKAQIFCQTANANTLMLLIHAT